MPRPTSTTAPKQGTTETAPITEQAPVSGTTGNSKMITEGNPTVEAPTTPAFSLEDAITEEVSDEAPATGQPQQQDLAVPDKFKGKSLEDVVRMYTELEQLHGRQAAELGQLRAPRQQDPIQQQQTPEDDGEEDRKLLAEMLASPKKFMGKLQQQFMQQLAATAQVAEINRVKAENLELIQNPAFISWARETVPPQLVPALDQDPQMLKFVLKSFQAAHPQQPQRAPTPKPTGVPAAPQAAQRGGKKPVFSEEAIRRLFIENPDEYNARMPEIEAAFREGRVK